MEQTLRKCKQCGEVKAMTEYRKYYGNSKGFYRVCRSCEAINSRQKYLTRKMDQDIIQPSEIEELDKIEELYELLRQRGLQPPKKREQTSSLELVNSLIAKHKEDIEQLKNIDPDIPTTTPPELAEWVTKELQGMDPEELEHVSDRLWRTYRPQVGIDEAFRPVYDDTYKNVLVKIQDRFDAYEDEFYQGD